MEQVVLNNNMELKFFNHLGKIDDIVNYIMNYIKDNPGDESKNIYSPYRIALGCDSDDRSRKTSYSITIVFYNEEEKDGAHVIYKNIIIPKSVIKKGQMFSQWKKEKVEIKAEDFVKSGDNAFIFNRLYIENQYLVELGLYIDEQLKGKYYRKHKFNDYDGSVPYRLPEIHLDYNHIGISDEGHENKSNQLYQMGMGLFCGYGFKVHGKPNAWAASSAANAYCRNK